MTTEPFAPTLEVLDLEECLSLARTVPIGRIAVARDSGPPLVLPVNFIIDGSVILFRSDPGAKLDALARRPVTFEIDHYEPLHQAGWSIVIEGEAYEGLRGQVERTDLRPWAPGDKAHWVLIVPTSITGRRLAGPVTPHHAHTYM